MSQSVYISICLSRFPFYIVLIATDNMLIIFVVASYIPILLQNSTSLTNNKKRNKKLVAPAIELGKHIVPVESKGSDEGSYCSTKGSHDYYLSTNSEDVYEDVYEHSPKAKSPATDNKAVIITNVHAQS